MAIERDASLRRRLSLQIAGVRALLDAQSPAEVFKAEERRAMWATAFATLLFALTSFWEMFGALGAGHYASNASMGIIAENMGTHRIIAPVWEYTDGPPDKSLYYCHHPWGIFWITRVFIAVLGHHDYVCRLPAVVLSVLTVPLVHGIARHLYRPYGGAVAAWGFVSLPISLSFANFNALEVPLMAFSALSLYGLVRFVQQPGHRFGAMAIGGLLIAMNCDWPAFVLSFAVATLLFIGLASPRHLGAISRRSIAMLWVGVVISALGTLGLYFILFRAAGKLDDLFASYDHRSAGHAEALSAVLERRKYWIEVCFTPIGIGIGKAASAVIVVRAVIRRNLLELLPVTVLAMALVQYLVFEQGADIHIFWPHTFALFYALGFAAVFSTALSAARSWDRMLRGAWLERIVLSATCIATALVLRDGFLGLDYARGTGGRFNEKGNFIQSDADKAVILALLRERRVGPIGLDDSMFPTWSQVWTVGERVILEAPHSVLSMSGTFVFDARFSNDAAKRIYASDASVEAFGPYWIVRRGDELLGRRFVEREPTLFEWYFESAHEPQRHVVDDPYVAWEVGLHYGREPKDPVAEPDTLDAYRVAYNLAVHRDDDARRAAMLEEIAKGSRAVDADLGAGVTLRFVHYEKSVSPKLSLLVEASGPREAGALLEVLGRVVAPPVLSSVGSDPVVRDVAPPFAIGPAVWRAGFLYSVTARYGRRPGREVFRARWRGAGGKAERVVVHEERLSTW
jgi:4-amino-4-deoxy-L-arabinose transferase-like glycosyltransferase